MQSLIAQKNSRWILKWTDIYLKPWGFSLLFYAGDTEKLCVMSTPFFAKASYLWWNEKSKNSRLFVHLGFFFVLSAVQLIA